MFKIGNSKELPTIPEHLSNEGKDFIMKCLQRDPLHRPTAAQLLDHPFVKNAVPPEKPTVVQSQSDPPFASTNGIISQVTYLSHFLLLKYWRFFVLCFSDLTNITC